MTETHTLGEYKASTAVTKTPLQKNYTKKRRMGTTHTRKYQGSGLASHVHMR